LLEKTELLTIKGIFALKVTFNQSKEDVLSKISEVECSQLKAISMMNSRLTELEKFASLKSMNVPNHYNRMSISDKI
jgi:hypothetical protein